MRNFLKRVCPFVYVVMLAAFYYILFHQMRQNEDHHEDRVNRVIKAHRPPFPHPLRILQGHEAVPYAAAADLATSVTATRYWLIADSIEPSVVINYFVYPKELRMAVRTQEMLNLRDLAMSREPIAYDPPQDYEMVIVVQGKTVRMMQQWDGNL